MKERSSTTTTTRTLSINCMIPFIILWIIAVILSQQCQSYQIIARSKQRQSLLYQNVILKASSKQEQQQEQQQQEQSLNNNDMAYTRDIIIRQAETYLAIRKASKGNLESICNDVYVHDVKTDLFWYVGKVARCSTVSIQHAIASQQYLIQQHAGRLRPVELGRKAGELELWIAPIDSELKVANGELELEKIEFDDAGDDDDDVRAVSLFEVGFNCEYVTNKGQGFFVKKNT